MKIHLTEIDAFGNWYWTSGLIFSIILILVTMYFVKKLKQNTSDIIKSGPPKLRFRKRDKMLFYGKRILRKMKEMKNDHLGKNRLMKKYIMSKLAKGLISLKQNNDGKPIVMIREPPPSAYEEDILDSNRNEHFLPEEVIFMLKSIQVFGHFEKPVFLELCRHFESVSVRRGQFLISLGQKDESMYVVQTGQIKVYALDADGSHAITKKANAGDTIYSLLSVLDGLSNNNAVFETVFAKAAVDSIVLRLPVKALQNIFQKYPQSMVRLVQIIMVRLQRVTFLALNSHLGLTAELLNPGFWEKDILAPTTPLKVQSLFVLKGMHHNNLAWRGEKLKTHRCRSHIHPSPFAQTRQFNTDEENFAARNTVSSSEEDLSRLKAKSSISPSNHQQPMYKFGYGKKPRGSHFHYGRNSAGRHLEHGRKSLGGSVGTGLEINQTRPKKGLTPVRERKKLAASNKANPKDFHKNLDTEDSDALTFALDLKLEEVENEVSSSPAVPEAIPSAISGILKNAFPKVIGERVSKFVGQMPGGRYVSQKISDFDMAFSRVHKGSLSLAQAALKTPTTKVVQATSVNNKDIPLKESRSKSTPNINEVEDEILNAAAEDIKTLLSLDMGMEALKSKLKLRCVTAGTVLVEQDSCDVSLMFVVAGILSVWQKDPSYNPSILGQDDNSDDLSDDLSDDQRNADFGAPSTSKDTDDEGGPKRRRSSLMSPASANFKEGAVCVFLVRQGEFVDALSVITGEASIFTITARTKSWVVVISKAQFYEILNEQPGAVLNFAQTVVVKMSPFLRQLDYSLDWMQVEAGRALYRQGDPSDCIIIVLSGRVRSVGTGVSDGKKEILGEYGRGELLGLVEVLTQKPRFSTMIAIRDTELAKIPEGLLELIKRNHPKVVSRLIHLLGQRLFDTMQTRTGSAYEMSGLESRPISSNLSTVAIVPATPDVPLFNFTSELQAALGTIGPTLKLDSYTIKKELGEGALDSFSEYRLSSWLGQQEDINRMVLYQCDYHLTNWTRRCVRQADCILILTLSDNGPLPGVLELQLENVTVRAQKELIIIHRDKRKAPKGTADWLNSRSWISSHHHIVCPRRMFLKRAISTTTLLSSNNNTLPSATNIPMPTFTLSPGSGPDGNFSFNSQMSGSVWKSDFYSDLLAKAKIDPDSDFYRLARFLTGTSIALVLGGGGAKGIAHVGMIKAIKEAGIPIDMVGGTSIGAFMGALWAGDRDVVQMTQRAREWSNQMTSIWKKVTDLTYPHTAMFTGGAFNDSIEHVFGDMQIEDLWIPYFNVTTDISSYSMKLHTSGCLWRYVRASMSLSGYLPPLCDPKDGHLLLDGGYCNNLPADVAKSMGAKIIIAVDVGSRNRDDFTNYGDELSGWWLLWNKWYPWGTTLKIPDMNEVQSRLAYVSCNKTMEDIKHNKLCEYFRPPIDKYKTLQFGSFDEIFETGYLYGSQMFSDWKKSEPFTEVFKGKLGENERTHDSKSVSPTFTDLVEIISKIKRPTQHRLRYRSIIPGDYYDELNHMLIGSADEMEYMPYVSRGRDSATNLSTSSFPEECALMTGTTHGAALDTSQESDTYTEDVDRLSRKIMSSSF